MLKNNKSLGQNWLKDRTILEEIAELSFEDVNLCLEIGPGLGTLTSSLLRRFPKVLAVEFDERLAANLPKSFPGKNLEVINQDFLQFDLETIKEPYVVAGNIPYYITTPIIEKLLTTKNQPVRIVLLAQKEVAEKLCPLESQLGHSSLSLFVDNFAEAHLGPVVTRDLFTPPPKVDSRVLVLIPRPAPQTDADTIAFIRHAFTSPRKKLSANLAGFTSLAKTEAETLLVKLGFDANARPADLSLADYVMLAKSIKK